MDRSPADAALGTLYLWHFSTASAGPALPTEHHAELKSRGHVVGSPEVPRLTWAGIRAVEARQLAPLHAIDLVQQARDRILREAYRLQVAEGRGCFRWSELEDAGISRVDLAPHLAYIEDCPYFMGTSTVAALVLTVSGLQAARGRDQL